MFDVLKSAVASIDGWEKLASIAESIATIAALGIGAWWTYGLFVKNRLGQPRLKLDCSVESIALTNKATLVRSHVKLENIGSVLVRVERLEVWLQQVLPLRGTVAERLARGDDPVEAGEPDVPWFKIGERTLDPACPLELEPGEPESFTADFVVKPGLELVQVYAFVENMRKGKDTGWSVGKTLSLKEDRMAKGRGGSGPGGDIDGGQGRSRDGGIQEGAGETQRTYQKKIRTEPEKEIRKETPPTKPSTTDGDRSKQK